MKRIVICLDGTWNKVVDPQKVTSVVKIAQAVRGTADDGTLQIVYYNSGVGTGDWIDKVLGGVFGRGLRANVKRAYAFLSLNYQPGDEIYIFGFSRGAFTARALAGVITSAGVLKKEEYEKFEIAWDFYRIPPAARRRLKDAEFSPDARREAAPATITPKMKQSFDRYVESKKSNALFVENVRVRCVGVWDTVGSYGIPAGIGLGALARLFTAYFLRGFHDTKISASVDIGLHAVAIDEKRRPFAPTFWTIDKEKTPTSHVEQVWFVGAHSNVGGGLNDCGLSDIALLWMAARAAEIGREKFNSALAFDKDFLRSNSAPSLRGELSGRSAGSCLTSVQCSQAQPSSFGRCCGTEKIENRRISTRPCIGACSSDWDRALVWRDAATRSTSRQVSKATKAGHALLRPR
jgi:uncharacterized protein (DUF2235 family)